MLIIKKVKSNSHKIIVHEDAVYRMSKDLSLNIGRHIALKDIVKHYAEFPKHTPIQVFTGSPRTYVRNVETVKKHIKGAEKLLGEIACYVHASYLTNIVDGPTKSKTLNYLEEDLEISDLIGAKGLVIHVPRIKDLDLEHSIQVMTTGILQLLEYTHKKKLKVKLLLETPSGQGSEILTNIDDFLNVCNTIKRSKYGDHFGIVIDTCHVFAAGYLPDEYIEYALKKYKGFAVDLVHLNDSKALIGARVDRHERLFKGKIPPKSLENVISVCTKRGIDMVLE